MLGWMISVHRQLGGGDAPAKPDCPREPSLAIWQTSLGGLSWLDDLVKQGKAIDLGGGGYPMWYTAPAKELIPFIADKPPLAKENWTFELHDVLLPDWIGKTKIDSAAIAECTPEEWLVVEAWDES